ncbi:hypothetical protein NVV95_02825 [Herbiconiux sp. CPCC 205716]|uniref:Uncharacterized protein n=1 Tax=Herbiconiux gentiana TaxID=2970912 RepID=A0ABT2GBF7_9MICO|nr:hypothetical protein [Herbiconiux gentiana]MCS5713483.1 hypothetical protein [Herbiconiux gentiana]
MSSPRPFAPHPAWTTWLGLPTDADPAVATRARRVAISAILWAVAYGMFTTGGSGRCGGLSTQIPDGKGGLLVSQECVSLSLHLSPLMFVAFVVILLVAVRRASADSVDRADAPRTLDRAAAAIALLTVAAVLISLAWWVALTTAWTPGRPFSYLLPFPLAILEVEVTP